MASPDADDQQLIRAIAAGSSTALETLYVRHGLTLLNWLLAWLQDRALAEETLQDVMLAVWAGASSFRGESQVRTWLYAIARRRAMHSLRQQHGRAPAQLLPLEHLDDRLATQDTVDKQLEAHDLSAALEHLPHNQQVALELVFFRGLSLAEAAAHLGININTLKSRLFRARVTLRKQILSHEDCGNA